MLSRVGDSARADADVDRDLCASFERRCAIGKTTTTGTRERAGSDKLTTKLLTPGCGFCGLLQLPGVQMYRCRYSGLHLVCQECAGRATRLPGADRLRSGGRLRCPEAGCRGGWTFA